ncbi:MAG: hypothetical protein HN413_14710 [Chloroflexi bacterium]|nr:hypothetical protein [Chloroflexota bacterium]
MKFPPHGWLGAIFIAIFWPLNWFLPGLRTHWAFFPLWLGYCLLVDGLVFRRDGTSLLTRSWRKYLGLFLLSVPVWWLFELLNGRLQNWFYDGREFFTDLEYGLLASAAFSTVIPAIFGAAELAAGWGWVQRMGRGPVIQGDHRTTRRFFVAGWLMLTLMLLWPRYFFPFVWLSLYFIMEPINIWLGNNNLTRWTQNGDWRPVMALWGGVLLTAFFWEFWNFFSYPKWIYTVPFVDFWHIFEMPFLGYGGYLPFALELYAIYNMVVGLSGKKNFKFVYFVK